MSFSRFLHYQAQLQLMPVLESGEEPTLVGGQAVLEGVMMRAPHSYCVAVRKPDGQIVCEEQPVGRMSEKYPIFKYPVFRGLGTLGQAMQLGFKALNFSTAALLEEELTQDAIKSGKPLVDGKAPEAPKWMTILNVVFAVGFFLVMYKVIPLLIAERLGTSRLSINIWDGVIRLVILMSFLTLLSKMKDMRRMFEYHGAEHKVVFNFESGKPVTIENAQKFVTFHPRCGTSFLLVMMVIAMMTYMFLPLDGFWEKLAARIVLLPVIIGMSYELIRFAAKRQGTMMGLLTAPGLWLQRVTTKPPDDAQTEIAIRALEQAMELEAKQGGQLVIA
ncbi:MAG: DUF1385 domain-containing protein [Acidobacteriota bacterium]